MKDKEDDILYIGMSVKLKQRVSSYFVDNADLNFAKKKMVKLVDHVDFIEAPSDLEALILETNLIKKHRPKYNILMKDDKNLSYIHITDDDIPMVRKTRIKGAKGKYFGPYSQYNNVWATLHELRKIFCLGNHRKLKSGWQPPCMDTYIGICPWHCTWDPEKIKTYKQNIEKFIEFMEGNTQGVVDELQAQMQSLAKELRFEEAGRLKDRIERLEKIHDRQVVRDAVDGDYDIIVAIDKYNQLYIWCVEVRWWQITGTYHYSASNTKWESVDSILSEVMMQRYIDTDFSGTILIGEDYQLWITTDFLSDKKIQIHTPKRWDKVELLKFAHTDVMNYALQEQMRSISNTTLKKSDMQSLLKALFPNDNSWEKKKWPLTFECFDISHHAWEHTVASKSVLINGKADTSKYKKYKIRTLVDGEIDDFQSMYEVLGRRTRAHCEGKEILPDLIIIDGGIWQLNKARSAIEAQYQQTTWEDVDISAIVRLCAVAKREEEIFLPDISEPVRLEKWSSELMLVQRARDEAHRFAIQFNRSKREKGYTKTVLDEIPGIGMKTRKKLLQEFSSIEGIGNAPAERLQEILTKKQFASLQEYGIVAE